MTSFESAHINAIATPVDTSVCHGEPPNYKKGKPLLSDPYNRTIDYLRISVTDRCNHRCVYCMPEEGVIPKHHDSILSYEQIEAIATVAASLGISKIRLTGGEPLVRHDIETLVAKLSQINGIKGLAMTTNATLLAKKAKLLKQNGLTRVNISIDSLNPKKYRDMTRGGKLKLALAGVDAAIKVGLTPIKINMVVTSDTSEDEINKMQEFCRRKKLNLQKIMQFSLYDRNDLSKHIQTERPPKCVSCNRLRLTADGFLKPCLFSEKEIKIDFQNIAASIRKAVSLKPENGVACNNRFMNQIGG